MTVNPSELSIPKLHKYLLGGVGPRPIAFASTIDEAGNRNLAPFSFFNVFSANPPILIFSPARSGRTNITKDTYNNVKSIAEVVINTVTYDMVQQMSLASSPFESGIDEFVKAGFTPVKSETVRPFRVMESPVQFECKVLEVKELGNEGAAGNLVICEVQRIHIHDHLIDEHGLIDQTKVDFVARMGGNWYSRTNEAALFEVAKPTTTIGIGVDALPEKFRLSTSLRGNHLGILGSMTSLPSKLDVENQLNRMDSTEITLSRGLAFIEANEPILGYAVLSKVLK